MSVAIGDSVDVRKAWAGAPTRYGWFGQHRLVADEGSCVLVESTNPTATLCGVAFRVSRSDVRPATGTDCELE